MATWFVYMVRCRDGSLYTGIALDVQARVVAHNGGRGARYTRSRRPVTLVHVERRRSRSSAQRREAAIKALSRGEKLVLAAGSKSRRDGSTRYGLPAFMSASSRSNRPRS